MNSASPFLHQDDAPRYRYVRSARYDREERDRVVAKITLERLRYRWWMRRGTLGSFMQRLGDFGREHFGFLDKHRTGGGWW